MSNITVTISGNGTQGCGIELTKGKIYSIGSQTITETHVADPCITNVKINGVIHSNYILDGQEITVSVTLDASCASCGVTGPTCVPSLFLYKMDFWTGKVHRYINIKSLLRKARRLN